MFCLFVFEEWKVLIVEGALQKGMGEKNKNNTRLSLAVCHCFGLENCRTQKGNWGERSFMWVNNPSTSTITTSITSSCPLQRSIFPHYIPLTAPILEYLHKLPYISIIRLLFPNKMLTRLKTNKIHCISSYWAQQNNVGNYFKHRHTAATAKATLFN